MTSQQAGPDDAFPFDGVLDGATYSASGNSNLNKTYQNNAILVKKQRPSSIFSAPFFWFPEGSVPRDPGGALLGSQFSSSNEPGIMFSTSLHDAHPHTKR